METSKPSPRHKRAHPESNPEISQDNGGHESTGEPWEGKVSAWMEAKNLRDRIKGALNPLHIGTPAPTFL